MTTGATNPKPRKQFAWYNWDKIYSFNGTYNFVVGNRGAGKTYGWQIKVIKAAIKKGEQFMYVRRYKDELKATKETFFDAVQVEFPDWHFRVMGSIAQMAPASTMNDKKRPWKTVGHFVALSTAQSLKGKSYPLVTNIGFDEFILEKGLTHYLPQEANAFNNLYSTVDRNQEKTKVFFMANAVSITNPYFLEYDIKPDGEFVIKSDGFVVVHFIRNDEFTGQIKETKFGKFIADTEYGKFAQDNEFSDNNDNLLNVKGASARYNFSIESNHGTFSVWIDWMAGKYYIQEKLPGRQNLYTLIPEKMEEGKILLGYSDKMMQTLRTAFRHGNTYFDTAKSRNAFIEIFKR